MALIGSITNWGEIQGQINDANGVLTGVISSAELLGGEIVGLRGLKGDKGDQGDQGEQGETGADGFSPSASVSKVGDTTTITITDKDGTKTASVYDGKPPVIFDYDLLNPSTPSYTEIGNALRDGKRCYVRLYKSGDLYGENTYLPLVGYSAEYYVFFAVTSTIGSYRALTYNVGTMSPAVYTTGFLQQQLVSGTNIKTINNESLLGSGNIDIQGGGASAFVAEYGVTTYADVKDAYDEDAIIICTVDDSGNTVVLQLAYYDDANDTFTFAQPVSEGSYWASVSIGDTWDDGYFQFASTDTATQLRNGLMSALDWQKLDGIASGAEVNVQSDWDEADSTDDAYIKNKPTIPSQPSDIGAQEALVSGTNIKTINNTSLLGSGDISTHGEDIFIAEVGSTSFQDLKAAYDDGKLIYTGRNYSDRVVYSPCYCDVVDPSNQMLLGCMSVDGYVRWYISYSSISDTTSWVRVTTAIQEQLVSGTNIKTINGTTLLGSGDISVGGDPNVQSDWNQSDNTADDYIKNKPTIPTLDMFYPVGSYYETSDGTFDPNVSWGGTWVLETEGQVHVSAGTGYTIGATGGEATHKLTTTEIPSHTHTITSYYREAVSYSSGTAARPYAKNGSLTTTAWAEAGNTGGGGAHNNMQPYIVVNRWHRTA